MKKFLSLILAVAMVLACTAALAEDIEFDKTGSEGTNSFVDDWAGKWVLESCYIGEEFADDNDIDVHGFITPTVENAVTLEIVANMDGSATGSSAGVMVDQAAYYHAHVNDLDGTVTYDASITEDDASIKCPWDGWDYTVPGEGVCNYNCSIGKLSKVGGGDKTLQFAAVSGVDNDAINDEGMKYIGITTDGKIVVCYSETNLTKKDGEIAFGYVFVRAAE